MNDLHRAAEQPEPFWQSLIGAACIPITIYLCCLIVQVWR